MAKKAFYDNDFRLGILGGGQLGKMLIQASGDLNVSPYILDQDETVPAAGLASGHVKGHFSQYEDVKRIGEQVDLLSIEIEHVNLDALYELRDEGLPVYPQPEVLAIIQDKGKQKDFYWQHNIPKSSYRHVADQEAVYRNKDMLPVFQKSCKAGYDGKGVQSLKTEEDLEQAFDTPSILEAAVDCEKELSVLVARTPSGQLTAYPPVEMAFHPEQNLVEYLFSPADISDEQSQEATCIAKDVAHHLGVVGLLAVELFLTPEGEILVNESAPRPHNSGHHTIEANETSQFHQHLRAILDLPLGNTAPLTPAAMVNVLGEPEQWGKPVYHGIEEVLSLSGAHPHIYGKPQTKPYRKMGHVTVTAPTGEAVKKQAEQVRETLKVMSHE
jgi:5-(carboxyamino)imidazole ribonucleotide synthase